MIAAAAIAMMIAGPKQQGRDQQLARAPEEAARGGKDFPAEPQGRMEIGRGAERRCALPLPATALLPAIAPLKNGLPKMDPPTIKSTASWRAMRASMATPSMESSPPSAPISRRTRSTDHRQTWRSARRAGHSGSVCQVAPGRCAVERFRWCGFGRGGQVAGWSTAVPSAIFARPTERDTAERRSPNGRSRGSLRCRTAGPRQAGEQVGRRARARAGGQRQIGRCRGPGRKPASSQRQGRGECRPRFRCGCVLDRRPRDARGGPRARLRKAAGPESVGFGAGGWGRKGSPGALRRKGTRPARAPAADAAARDELSFQAERSAAAEVTVLATPDQFVATLRDLRQHSAQFFVAPVELAGVPGEDFKQLAQPQFGDVQPGGVGGGQPGGGQSAESGQRAQESLELKTAEPHERLASGRKPAQDRSAIGAGSQTRRRTGRRGAGRKCQSVRLPRGRLRPRIAHR